MPKLLNFYVFVAYDNLTQNSLRIPIEFNREHLKQIQSNENIILMVSDNKKWPIGWTNSTYGHLLLQKGWPEFAEHYGIKTGHFLLFEHQGSSNFHIRIFDQNSCEITYVPFVNSHLEKEIDQPVLQTNSNVQETKGEAVNTELALKSRSKSKAFKSDNRFYSVILSASNLKSNGLYLPNAFCRRCLTGENKSGDCMLQTPDGKNWGLIQCSEYDSFGRLSGKNWKKFCHEEHLGVGDVCTFELINEVEKVLKVTIVRANKQG
ncbi:B3 domain-containing protein REM9-like [Rutidosis leptorrhynchoides]|uniref:B3 domain-containing protein REM9-like n=1 Tax=Rutidosis leptorrhynchoides TaxID=125765 RepID=UPI003A995398